MRSEGSDLEFVFKKTLSDYIEETESSVRNNICGYNKFGVLD